MKRLLTVLVMLAVGLVLFAPQSSAVVSPPNWVNFQGFITDTTGAPVADGTYNVDFYVYDDSTGGTPLWTELTTQTTTSGRFTHQLGSVTPFGYNFFYNNDTLYLETVVEGEVISPRTPITSSPYSLVSAGLEIQGCCTDPGVAAMDTEPGGYSYRVFSDGGDLRAQLGFYYEGALELYDGSDSLQISLSSGSTGDAAAILPNDAISSPEILDEPGLANSFKYGTSVLTTSTVAYDTVSLTAPGPGYVMVIAQGFFRFNTHTSGTADYARAYISDTASSDYDNLAIECIEPTLGSYSGDYGYRTFAITKVEAVTAGTHTYYLTADKASTETISIGRTHLTVMYFPTAYGTVVNSLAATKGAATSTSMGGAGLQPQLETITMEDHNARLAAEVAQLKAEMQARLEKLERRVNQPEKGNPQK